MKLDPFLTIFIFLTFFRPNPTPLLGGGPAWGDRLGQNEAKIEVLVGTVPSLGSFQSGWDKGQGETL